MKKFVYDVVIVGAGPAGLMAAETAATLGLTVCIVEIKKDFEQLNRACSMQLILDDGYESEWLQVKDNKWIFQYNQFEVAYNGISVPIHHKYYHSPSDHIIHFANESNEPFAIKFDKQKLLSDLYHSCLSKNVTFHLNTVAVSGKDNGDFVSLDVVTGGTKNTLFGQKLIIAEGVNARVSKIFGFGKNRLHFATALTAKYFLEGVKDIEPNSWNLYYGKIYHSNVPVIIGPSLLGDHIVEMTLTGDQILKPQQIFETLLTQGPLAKQLKNSVLVKKNGCTVKAFSSLKKPYEGNVLVIGDTAAFVEVETQGALMCGYHAAHAISKELGGNDGFTAYTNWWKDAFEFNGDDYMSVSQGYALVPTYSDNELDYLFALIENKRLDGTYSQYKTPKLIWSAILEHKEQIQAEHPEIYEKIEHMWNMSLKDSLAK